VDDILREGRHDVEDGDEPWVIANLKWSHDDSMILFRFSDTTANKVKELYVMRADGSELTKITAATKRFHHHSWTSDGTRILYGDRSEQGEPRLLFDSEW